MLRFADSTLAWDDDSDSRSSPKATIRTDDISNEGEIDSQDSENESESESEEEDDDEELNCQRRNELCYPRRTSQVDGANFAGQ